MTWRRDALCLGTDTSRWFPGRNQPATTHLQLCRACPVRQECLDDELALMRQGVASFGIRGGLMAEQRHAVIRAERVALRRGGAA